MRKTGTSDWNNDGVNDTWIQGYPYSSKQKVFVNVYDVTKDVTIDNSAGYTKVKFTKAPWENPKANFMAGVAVKMTVDNYLEANETVAHVSGLNTFCGACHTDYNTEEVAGSGSNLNGTYTEAYRHKVGFDREKSKDQLLAVNMKLESGKIVTCATCHVAHGTDEEYWQDTLSIADDDLKEISGSSALKRLPNMGVCEACHAKGAASQGSNSNGYTPDPNPTSVANFNTGTGILDYAGLSNTTVNGKKAFGLFLQANGTGFFKNEEYAGAEACKSCHAEFYEGWKEEGHSQSQLTPTEAGLPAEFAGTGIVTKTITSTGFVNGVPSGTPAGTVSWSYTIDTVNKTMTYDYYAAAGGKTAIQNAIAKTPQGTAVVNLSDISSLWMEHYVISKVNPTAGGPAVPAYGYYRVAQFDKAAPVGEKLHPYLLRGQEFPTAPSIASYFANNADSSTETTGCLSCHSPKSQGAKGSPDSTISCEACHGPAARHTKAPSAKNIFNPGNPINGLTPTQQNNLCLTCHSGGHNAVAIKGTVHDVANAVTCISCHDLHNSKVKHSNLNATPDLLCSSCHQNKGVEATKAVHTL